MKLNSEINLSTITKITLTQKQFVNLFYIFMFTFILFFFLSLFFLGFNRIVYPIADTIGNLTDFFDPIAQIKSFDSAYDNYRVMYPPLITFLIAFMSSFVPPELLHPIHAFALRDSDVGLTIFLTYILIVLPIFIILLMSIRKSSVKDKILWACLMLLSEPFIYMFDRGNYILLALIFMFLFILCYDSKKYLLRHLSIIFLAVAISIKIYPAALGILLLQEKRFKDILFLGFYSILFFLLPLVYLGGIDSFYLLIRNLKMNSAYSIDHRGYGYTYSLTNTIKMIVYACTHKEFVFINNLLPKLSFLFLLVGSFLSYFIKPKWKTLTLVSLMMIIVPTISYVHTGVLMILPLAVFLNDTENKTLKDIVYLFLFVLILSVNIPMDAPIIYPIKLYDISPVLWDNFCARLAMLVMFILLCYDGYIYFKSSVKLWKK